MAWRVAGDVLCFVKSLRRHEHQARAAGARGCAALPRLMCADIVQGYKPRFSARADEGDGQEGAEEEGPAVGWDGL